MSEVADDYYIRPGVPEDAPAIATLLRACGADCIPEPVAWVRERAHHFNLATDASGRLAATAALLPASRDSHLLRSVAVDPRHRGTRLAARVLAPLLEHARGCGAAVWCRTTRPGFFRRLAFRDAGSQPGPDDRPRYRMVRPSDAAPVPSSTDETHTNPNPTHERSQTLEDSMSTNVAFYDDSTWSAERDAPRSERKVKPRRKRLAICPATYPEMKIAADIVRSTASWYRPILEPEDMAEHDVGQEWIDANYDRRSFYLGWRDDRPVGVLSMQETGDYVYLGYVYLYEHEVGHGYGRELLEFARDRAREMGKKGLVLIAHPEASWATKAYERFGFARVAKTREDVLAWRGGWLEPYYEEGFELYEMQI